MERGDNRPLTALDRPQLVQKRSLLRPRLKRILLIGGGTVLAVCLAVGLYKVIEMANGQRRDEPRETSGVGECITRNGGRDGNARTLDLVRNACRELARNPVSEKAICVLQPRDTTTINARYDMA